MKNALLIHGWNTKGEYYDSTRPTASNDHWFPWLTKQLVLNDINTVSIEMPDGYYPQYDTWKKELERYDITQNTIFVGHSCGGGFLVRWLSESNVKVGKVILVAPWLGYDVNSEPFDSDFFNFKIDADLAKKTDTISIFVSDDDEDGIQHSVGVLIDKIKGINVRTFEGKGHFTLKSLGGPTFPELAEELLR